MRGPKRAKGNPTRKPDDKAQFERFFETIRKSGVEEGRPALDGEPKDILPQNLLRSVSLRVRFRPIILIVRVKSHREPAPRSAIAPILSSAVARMRHGMARF